MMRALSSVESERKPERRTDGLVLAVLLAGFAIGAFALGYMERALDADEYVTLEAVRQPLATMVQRADLLYPPLYFGALKLWTMIVGASVLSIRLFSLVFAVLALYLVYRCGVELFSRREALWATLLLAFSNFHLYYATEARMYSMVEAGGLIVTLAFFRALRSSGERARGRFIAAVAFLSLTHYFAWFFLLGQGLYFFLSAKRKMRGVPFWWAKGVLPFFGLSLGSFALVHRLYPQAWDNLRTLQDLGARSLSGVFYLLGAFHGMLPFPDTMRYGFLPWSLPFLAFGWKWARGRSASPTELVRRFAAEIKELAVTPSGYVLFTLIVPIVGLTFLSVVLFPLFLPRYLIYGLPIYYLLVSRCAVLATPSARRQLLLLLPALGWSLASALSYHLLRWFG